MVVRRMASKHDPFVLDAELTLRDGLRHPDLTPFVELSDGAITMTEDDGECVLFLPGGSTTWAVRTRRAFDGAGLGVSLAFAGYLIPPEKNERSRKTRRPTKEIHATVWIV